MRYNGAVCRHGIVPIEAGAHDQRLDITLAPASGSVVATATDATKPSAGASVLLVREPVDDDAMLIALKHFKADANGQVTITGLVPGTYRLTAYPEGALWADDPNVKQRLATGEEARFTDQHTVRIQVRTQPRP